MTTRAPTTCHPLARAHSLGLALSLVLPGCDAPDLDEFDDLAESELDDDERDDAAPEALFAPDPVASMAAFCDLGLPNVIVGDASNAGSATGQLPSSLATAYYFIDAFDPQLLVPPLGGYVTVNQAVVAQIGVPGVVNPPSLFPAAASAPFALNLQAPPSASPGQTYDVELRLYTTTNQLVCVDTLSFVVPAVAPFADGTRVRLRHANTDQCAYTQGGDGRQTRNWQCWADPNMVFVLDRTLAGRYRIRHEGTNQCLYTHASNGSPVDHWSCWNDPNMEFVFVPYQGGYRIRNVSDWVSLYGDPANGGLVRSEADAADSDQVFVIDVLPPATSQWTAWLDRDDPGGTGDWESHGAFQPGEVCASPSFALCETVGGTSHWNAGENVSCSPAGLACQNGSQTDGLCQDYRVKFYCP